MTTQEFQNKLDNCKTISDLQKLRSEATAPKYVSLIKEKVVILANIEGFDLLTCKMSNLKKLTSNTNTNTFVEIDVPLSNRIFAKYKGSKVLVYVNHKSGTNYSQEAYILIKKI